MPYILGEEFRMNNLTKLADELKITSENKKGDPKKNLEEDLHKFRMKYG